MYIVEQWYHYLHYHCVYQAQKPFLLTRVLSRALLELL
jgi:hypothetical protein